MATTEDRRDTLDGIAEWRRALYEAAAEREGELFSTISGLEIDPLYTADSVEIDEKPAPSVSSDGQFVQPQPQRGTSGSVGQSV